MAAAKAGSCERVGDVGEQRCRATRSRRARGRAPASKVMSSRCSSNVRASSASWKHSAFHEMRMRMSSRPNSPKSRSPLVIRHRSSRVVVRQQRIDGHQREPTVADRLDAVVHEVVVADHRGVRRRLDGDLGRVAAVGPVAEPAVGTVVVPGHRGRDLHPPPFEQPRRRHRAAPPTPGTASARRRGTSARRCACGSGASAR